MKVKEISELKNVYDFDKRLELLENAYKVSIPEVNGRKILLIDDLFRSGATLKAVSDCLAEKGGTQAIYVLTMSKTRSNR